jgi:DNA polymerase-3 subunit delta'
VTARAPYPWQEQAWRTLTATLESGRLPHSLLINGPAGVGKHQLALALVARIFCKQAKGEERACGHCGNCQLIAAGSHPDYVCLTVEEDKTRIAVQQVRDMIAHLGMKSYRGAEKVALVHPADAMNMNSANSLLKTLEEPTDGTLLILVTSRPSRLPATILSRCQRVEIRPPGREQALAWLVQEHGKADWGPALAFAAGAPLKAAELCQAGYAARITSLEQQIGAIVAGRADPTAVASEWAGKDPDFCLEWLKMWTGHLIRGRSLGNLDISLEGVEGKKLESFIQLIDLRMIFKYLDDVNRSFRLLETTVNKQSLMEAVLIPWAHELKRVLPIAE